MANTAAHHASPSAAPTRRRYVIFGLAASVSFLLYLHRYTWNLIRPELQSTYNLSNTQLETLGSAFYFPYAAAQVPGGILCDLFGPHLFLVAIILIWSLILPLFGSVSSFPALVSIRAGFGLAQAGAYPALSQVTRAWFPRRNRTGVQGWIASAFGRGGGAMASIIMGTFLMGYLQLSWVSALTVLSAVGVIFALLFFFVFRNDPAHDPHTNQAELDLIRADEQPDHSTRRVLPFGVALSNRSFLFLLAQQFLVAGSDVIFALILGSYFASLGVVDKKMLGILISLPLWGGAVGGIVGGYINDWVIRHVSNRRLGRSVVAFTGLMIGGLLLLSAVGSSDPVRVGLGLMLARFFSDWAQPTVWGTCTDLGGKYSATVFGFGNMLGNFGAFLTPFVIGPLLDHYSTMMLVNGEMQRQTNFVPAFVMCGGMMLVAAFCWLLIDSSRPIVPPETEPVA